MCICYYRLIAKGIFLGRLNWLLLLTPWTPSQAIPEGNTAGSTPVTSPRAAVHYVERKGSPSPQKRGHYVCELVRGHTCCPTTVVTGPCVISVYRSFPVFGSRNWLIEEEHGRTHQLSREREYELVWGPMRESEEGSQIKRKGEHTCLWFDGCHWLSHMYWWLKCSTCSTHPCATTQHHYHPCHSSED